MEEIKNLTQAKLKEWQIRRLEIKDQMQSNPEKILELSRVLDLMDEEHTAIFSGAAENQAENVYLQGSALHLKVIEKGSHILVGGKFDLQLHVAAHSAENLRTLLEMAVYELQAHVDTESTVATGRNRKYPGDMSGTLGSYHFEFCVNDKAIHD